MYYHLASKIAAIIFRFRDYFEQLEPAASN